MEPLGDRLEIRKLEKELDATNTEWRKEGHWEGYGGWTGSGPGVHYYEPTWWVCDNPEVQEKIGQLKEKLIEIYNTTNDIIARDLAGRAIGEGYNYDPYNYSKIRLFFYEHPVAAIATGLVTTGAASGLVYALVEYFSK